MCASTAGAMMPWKRRSSSPPNGISTRQRPTLAVRSSSTTAAAAACGFVLMVDFMAARQVSSAPAANRAAICGWCVFISLLESPPTNGIGSTGVPTSSACSMRTSVCTWPLMVTTMSTPRTIASRRPRAVRPATGTMRTPSAAVMRTLPA